MSTNDIIKKIYAAFVRKAKAHCLDSKSAQETIDVGTDVIAVGQTWTSSFGNDGKIDADEEADMNRVFGSIIDRRCKPQTGIAVGFLYNGFTFFGYGWKGLKYYLNQWFDLDLD